MIVKYSKKFPYAPYLNEDIGFEIELEDTEGKPLPEAIQVTLGFLKEMAEKFHKANNQQLTDAATVDWKPNYDFTTTPIPTVDYRAKEKLEIDIDNATTKQDLEFYVDAAEKYGLMELWNEKNNSLK